MYYRSLIVTPIVEQSGFRDSTDQVFRVSLHFKLWDKSHLFGEATYFKSNKSGEFFSYDPVIREYMENWNEEEIDEVHNNIKEEINRDIKATSALIPLKQFVCDQCNKVVEENEAVLEFSDRYDNTGEYNFEKLINTIRIVHCTEDKDCRYTEDEMLKYGGVMSLGQFTGELGLSNLIGLIEEYPNEPSWKEIIKIIKRTYLPHYEEARVRKDLIEERAGSLDWPMMKYQRENLRNVIMDIHQPEEREKQKNAKKKF